MKTIRCEDCKKPIVYLFKARIYSRGFTLFCTADGCQKMLCRDCGPK